MAGKYNPYNDYKKIVGYKGDWHNAQSFGQDPNQYKNAAMPYYQSLIDNGYGELADALSQSDYTQAKGLRDKYGLKPDNEYNLDYAVTATQKTILNAFGMTADNIHRQARGISADLARIETEAFEKQAAERKEGSV